MKPRGDLMVDNRNAINGNKIESEEQGQHKPRNDRIKRGFLFSRCQERKAINSNPESRNRRQCK
jgi:hypothetical protein